MHQTCPTLTQALTKSSHVRFLNQRRLIISHNTRNWLEQDILKLTFTDQIALTIIVFNFESIWHRGGNLNGTCTDSIEYITLIAVCINPPFSVHSTRDPSDLPGLNKAYEVGQFPLSWEATGYFHSGW